MIVILDEVFLFSVVRRFLLYLGRPNRMALKLDPNNLTDNKSLLFRYYLALLLFPRSVSSTHLK